MDFLKATQKISDCIDTATTSEHHKVINRMIETVTLYAKIQKPWDNSLKGALALLDWQNAIKHYKLKFKNKFGN